MQVVHQPVLDLLADGLGRQILNLRLHNSHGENVEDQIREEHEERSARPESRLLLRVSEVLPHGIGRRARRVGVDPVALEDAHVVRGGCGCAVFVHPYLLLALHHEVHAVEPALLILEHHPRLDHRVPFLRACLDRRLGLLDGLGGLRDAFAEFVRVEVVWSELFEDSDFGIPCFARDFTRLTRGVLDGAHGGVLRGVLRALRHRGGALGHGQLLRLHQFISLLLIKQLALPVRPVVALDSRHRLFPFLRLGLEQRLHHLRGPHAERTAGVKHALRGRYGVTERGEGVFRRRRLVRNRFSEEHRRRGKVKRVRRISAAVGSIPGRVREARVHPGLGTGGS